MNRSLTLLVTLAYKRSAAKSRIAVLLSLAVAGLFISACESPEERAAGYLENNYKAVVYFCLKMCTYKAYNYNYGLVYFLNFA